MGKMQTVFQERNLAFELKSVEKSPSFPKMMLPKYFHVPPKTLCVIMFLFQRASEIKRDGGLHAAGGTTVFRKERMGW